jgi:hypothetical protein
MARPTINTTAENFKAAIESKDALERETPFINNFLIPLVNAINGHIDTVDLPDDDDLSIAKATAYVEANGFGIARIGDKDENGNCKYRIYTREVREEG